MDNRRALPLLPLVLACCLLAVSKPASAAAPPLAVPWTVDDLAAAESPSDVAVARDGRAVAWVRSTVAEVDGGEKRVANLWISRDGAPSTALTRGRDRAAAPVFAPGGTRLAFLSDRAIPGAKGADAGGPAKRQAWVLPLAGGDPFPATRFDQEVQAVAWLDDATLLVAAAESRSAWALAQERDEKQAVVVEDAEHEPPVRLYRVSVDGGAVKRLTTNADWIDSIAVSPDGRHAVVTAQQSLAYAFDQRRPPRAFLVDTASGASKPLLGDLPLVASQVAWSPDGRGFFFTNEFTRDAHYRNATITELWFQDLAKPAPEKVDLGWERGLGEGFAPTRDGFVALLAEGVRLHPARYRREGAGWKRVDLATDAAASAAKDAAERAPAGSVEHFDVAADGTTVVVTRSSATVPRQLSVARLASDRGGDRLTGERRISDLNAGWEAKPKGRVDVVRWKGARGEEVEGLLFYPLDWQEGAGPRPLVLHPHGGPSSLDRDSWEASWHDADLLWRQRGAFVLQPNYHGSTGYGLDWVESIAGHYYELEVPDLETGVDHVVAMGLADPQRLGVVGWSNGGILAAALITGSHRFKAASIGAADVEWFSDWANVDFGAAFDNYYFGGTPLEKPEVYLAKSPFFKLDTVTTPTVVFTGTADRNVPPHQSWSLFRAIQQHTDTPVRLVLFPGEPHGLREPVDQRRKITEELAWLDRYLFAKEEPARPWLRADSPLAALLARHGASRGAAALGVEKDGLLVPETVAHGGLEVGRFEVTRAQLRAFDPQLAVAPGEEDLPAAGVSFERAQAYVRWLAERTGRPFRLPTRAEAEALAAEAKEAPGDGGNTLARWAGYAPNPEDAAALRGALAPLGPAPLLLPVGSLPGTGDPALFDLDGNVAEWATDGSDATKGVAIGPSAERAKDERAGDAPADPAYVGLRVVVGR